MSIPKIETPHLILRAWTPSDANSLFEILQETDMFKYFPQTKPPQRPWVDKYIHHHLTHWDARGYGHWAVINQKDGQVIGWTGLEYLPETDETEVAYLLSRTVWGRGFATEAACAAVRFGKETYRLPVIIGLVHPENIASIKVLEKCGLVFNNRATYWGLEMLRYLTPSVETK